MTANSNKYMYKTTSNYSQMGRGEGWDVGSCSGVMGYGRVWRDEEGEEGV